MKTVITFGTYDLFHIGHLRIIERAKTYGDILIVGISSDELNHSKKNKYPIYDYNSRSEIIKSMKCVNEVFKEESLDKKRQYITDYSADVLVMGDDWTGKFDHIKDIVDVVYLPRTQSISTTETIEKIINTNNCNKYMLEKYKHVGNLL